MTLQSMLGVLRKQPFEPFRLVMSSGQAYKVPRRDLAFLTRSDLLVGVDVSDDGLAGHFKTCPLDQIAAVEPLNDPMPYP
jgi:hypothetical protein